MHLLSIRFFVSEAKRQQKRITQKFTVARTDAGTSNQLQISAEVVVVIAVAVQNELLQVQLVGRQAVGQLLDEEPQIFGKLSAFHYAKPVKAFSAHPVVRHRHLPLVPELVQGVLEIDNGELLVRERNETSNFVTTIAMYEDLSEFCMQTFRMTALNRSEK